MTIDELITKLQAAKLEYGGATPVLIACDDDEDDLPYHKTFGTSWHPTIMDGASYWPEGAEEDGNKENAFILLAD